MSSRGGLGLAALVGVVTFILCGYSSALAQGSGASRQPTQATRVGKAGKAERAAAALRSGQYEEARRLADAGASRKPDPASTIVAARAQMALGLYEEARERLEKAVDRAPRHLPLRQALCEVMSRRGDRAALKPYVELTYDDWSARRVDLKDADDLLAVAAIMRMDDNWQDANDTLRAAVRADPKNPRPNIFWGRVFLEKHAIAEAETSFRAALAADPTDPDARVGLANVHVRKRYDIAAAEAELTAALRINARHAGALALRAEIAIDGEDFEMAAALIAKIRRTNPRDADAAWLEASRARLLDDDSGYQRARDEHAAVHPSDGDFFASTADVLIRHRRTDDARVVAEEGVAVDPLNAHCQSVLGTTLLRLGREAAGVEALRRAWKRDPYDARTYNLLELYEKVVPGMQTFKTKHLAFRVDPSARIAIERVVAPFLEETYARYAAKYRFEPTGPITFELYTNPDHFAIRTVGMPGIGVEAVCFGRVITSQSPTNGKMNWGMVLAHELAHVFAIELSRSRVPRWFTEGLAELETMRARPEWGRHAERSLWGAAYRGELASLTTLSNGFVRARNAEEATRAYAQAAAALDYLDRTFGFARIRDALVRFGSGARGLGVVAAATGVSTDDLERGFRADLAARGAAFDRQYLPAETLRGDGDSRPPAANPGALSPAGRADAEARKGLAYLRSGDTSAAARALESARGQVGGRERRAVLFLAGELALALRKADEARAAFLELLSPTTTATTDTDTTDTESGVTRDGYDVRVRLALAEIHRHDFTAAEQHLKRAIAFDPGSAEATGLLVELLGDPFWRGTRVDDRLREIAATLRLEPLHAGLAKDLVFGLARRGRVTEVIDAAPMAIFIEPALPALHAALGRALAKAGKTAAAATALEHALALGPPPVDQTELRDLLDRLYVKLGAPRRRAPNQTPTPVPAPP
ncbi:MAG: tetratricopeptide repeat protein [Deltaproteobacteria bacterium]|nr:tetratricopeptide repeat protein [Deltaproteobacteria bacterium]